MAAEDVLMLRTRERDAALLDILFGSAPVGLAFLDEELRYVRVNGALAELHGVPAQAHVGRTVLEVVPGMDPGVVDCMRRRAAIMGRGRFDGRDFRFQIDDLLLHFRRLGLLRSQFFELCLPGFDLSASFLHSLRVGFDLVVDGGRNGVPDRLADAPLPAPVKKRQM